MGMMFLVRVFEIQVGMSGEVKRPRDRRAAFFSPFSCPFYLNCGCCYDYGARIKGRRGLHLGLQEPYYERR